jgi:hypothetical protein
MMFYKAYEMLTALRAILALIAIVSIAVLKLIGVNVSRVFTGVNNQLDSVPDAP